MRNIYPIKDYKYPKLTFRDEGTQAIDNAYSIISSTFEDYIKDHDVADKDIEFIKNTIDRVYHELKGAHLVNSMLKSMLKEIPKITEEMLTNWAKYSSLYDIQDFFRKNNDK